MHDITSNCELPASQNGVVYEFQVLAARKARNQRKEAGKEETEKRVSLLENIIK
jgi:NAD+--asparagine ADP-ribosyltransferase